MPATAALDRMPDDDRIGDHFALKQGAAAISSPWIRIGPLLAALMAAAFGFVASAADFLHESSGIRFPASIEGRFLRGSVKDDGKQCTVTYSTRSGSEVTVHVQSTKQGAKGPSKLDGDEHSDASPLFKEEMARNVQDSTVGLAGASVFSKMRFHAGAQTGPPAQRGPIGMKATVRGKLDGKLQNRELLLCERNGFFVRFTTSYAAENWLKVGLIYTDVAHFLRWPASAITPSLHPTAKCAD